MDTNANKDSKLQLDTLRELISELDLGVDIVRLQAALVARVLRLSDEANPAENDPCRKGRKGIIDIWFIELCTLEAYENLS